MSRAVLGGAAALAVAALLALATVWPRPGSRAASAEHYPLDVGLQWTYRGVGNLRVVRRIDRTLEIAGRPYFEMTYVMPLLGTKTLPMRAASDGVVTVRGGREFLLLKLPMVRGDRWTIDLPGEPEIAECEVGGDEELDLEGSVVRATKVEVRRRRRSSDRASVEYEWYADGKGLVKMEVSHGLRATFVLERFERVRATSSGDSGSRPSPPDRRD